MLSALGNSVGTVQVEQHTKLARGPTGNSVLTRVKSYGHLGSDSGLRPGLRRDSVPWRLEALSLEIPRSETSEAAGLLWLPLPAVVREFLDASEIVPKLPLAVLLGLWTTIHGTRA